MIKKVTSILYLLLLVIAAISGRHQPSSFVDLVSDGTVILFLIAAFGDAFKWDLGSKTTWQRFWVLGFIYNFFYIFYLDLVYGAQHNSPGSDLLGFLILAPVWYMSYHFAFKVASETDKSHNTLPIGPRTKNALLAGFWLLASIAFIVLPLVSINFVFDHFVTTTTTKTETIHTPFTTELEQDPLVAPAESYTSDGTVGVTEVTYQIKTRDGKQVAKTETNSQVITQAEPQIYHQGTLSPITPQLVVGTVRTGARCNDGSYSGATGRGACSWHGGVAEWLY